jgi:hypothetical protein
MNMMTVFTEAVQILMSESKLEQDVLPSIDFQSLQPVRAQSQMDCCCIFDIIEGYRCSHVLLNRHALLTFLICINIYFVCVCQSINQPQSSLQVCICLVNGSFRVSIFHLFFIVKLMTSGRIYSLKFVWN